MHEVGYLSVHCDCDSSVGVLDAEQVWRHHDGCNAKKHWLAAEPNAHVEKGKAAPMLFAVILFSRSYLTISFSRSNSQNVTV